MNDPNILLEKLFISIPSFFKDAKVINVLVICAGSFPSYTSLVQQLSRSSPRLEEVNFTLVEPIKTKTDTFAKLFSKLPAPQLRINYTIANLDMCKYLQHEPASIFDLVYFEHPDMRTINILYEKLFSFFTQKLSLRETMPYLAKVLKPEAFIIASCVTQHELNQLKGLLKYSLGKKPDTVVLNTLENHAGFSTGLSCSTHRPQPPIDLQKKRAEVIKKSDYFLCFFFLVAVGIYCMKFTEANNFIPLFIVPLFITAQLWLHRPGYSGQLIQILLLLGQLALYLLFT